MKLLQESVLQIFNEETELKLKKKALRVSAQYTAQYKNRILLVRLY